MLNDDNLKKILQAAKAQEEGQTTYHNTEDAERAEDMGFVEVESGGRLTLTDKGRKKLAQL